MNLSFEQISPEILAFLARMDFSVQEPGTLAGMAGSKRAYYRFKNGIRSYILLVSPEEDLDFGRFLRITQFYRLMNFPVPKVYCIDDAKHQVLLEDLGHQRLYEVYHEDSALALDAYKAAVDQLIDLQTRCFQAHQESPDIYSRVFGMADLLWESQYYRTRCLKDYFHISLQEEQESALQRLFQLLAIRVERQPKTIMHRDFQSQNLMWCRQNIRVIDYQGSRLGSRFYDLASLLLDPYTQLSDSFIEELLAYYHFKTALPLSKKDLEQEFLLAGAQRIMQALGAYGYLTQVKKLDSFHAFIEPGCRRLAWIAHRCQILDLSPLIFK